MNIKKSIFHSLLIALAIVLAFGVGFVFSQSFFHPVSQLPEEFNVLEEVWQSLQIYYVNKDALDAEALAEGAINGLLGALDDPYTSYLDAKTYEMEWSAFEGSFEGIGAVVTMKDGELTVVSPIADGPAEEQGVRAGDKVLEIDGEPTLDMNLTEAVLKIRGPQGTKVTLLILHQGETKPVEIEIIREEVKLDSIYLEMLPEGIAHIQLTHFSERTHEELIDALNEAIDNGVEGIILDLRDNPGGYLHVAVDVASEFLDGGTVVYQQDSKGQLEEMAATPGGLATYLPLVVLINEWSASGSEVLAGALQDRGRATLVGNVTFGKGSINIIRELSDGSALYVTTARWLTPNGNLIEGVGLTPDYTVTITDEDVLYERDPQLEFAIDYIKSQL